jgi:hypothetical protein
MYLHELDHRFKKQLNIRGRIKDIRKEKQSEKEQ